MPKFVTQSTSLTVRDNTMPTSLSILVFVASPLDYARYRHTALYFEFEPQAQAPATNNPQTNVDTEYIKSSVMEVIGSPGFMSFSERENLGIPVSSSSEIDRYLHISLPKFLKGFYYIYKNNYLQVLRA